jgi:hypothetical protein
MKPQLSRTGRRPRLVSAAIAGANVLAGCLASFAQNDPVQLTNVYNPVADAFTFSVYPEITYGTAYNVLELYKSPPTDAMWSFLRFDLAQPNSIPSGSTITSAELQLYMSSSSGQGPFPVQVYSVGQSWSEGAITWSNQPPPDTLFTATNLPPGTNVWLAWDVTTLVQQWGSGARTNQGLVLVPGGTNAMQLFFPSREAATNQPRLVVNYTPPTNCLSISCSTNITTYLACGSNCVSVPFAVTGSNACNPQDIFVQTEYPSGYCFTLGTTEVHATALSSTGQSNQCSFFVTVLQNSNCLPPTITSQPQSQNVTAGNLVTLSLTATGTSPLAYQWFRNGQSLAGVTGDTLTIPHASLADAGSYFCRVANSFGQADSSNAVLTVNPLSFQGLANSPLGNARIYSQSNELVVSNIGSTGTDGVSLDLSGFHFGTLSLEEGASSGYPSSVYLRVYGEVNGATNQFIGTLGCMDASPSNMEYSVDFGSIGGVANTVLVYDGSNLVATAHGVTGAVASVTGPEGANQLTPYATDGGQVWAVVDLPSRSEITLPGSPAVLGTRLAISPEANKLTFYNSPIIVAPHVTIGWPKWAPWYKATLPPPWWDSGHPAPYTVAIGALSRIEVLAENTGELRILKEQAGMWGLLHQPVGDASLDGGTNWLQLGVPGQGNPLGSGTSWPAQPLPISHPGEPPGPINLKVQWQRPFPQDIAGSFLKVNVNGTLGGVSNQILGFVEATKMPTNCCALVADFSAIGSTQSVVTVFSGGVAIYTGLASDGVMVADVCAWPTWFHGPGLPFDPRVCDLPPADVAFGFETNTWLNLWNGTNVFGDQIRIQGNPWPPPSFKFESFSLLIGGGLTNLTIIKEELLPVGQIFDGLGHVPIGAATFTTVSNELVVSNLVANANFGASIALGDAGGGELTLAGPDDTSPSSAELRMSASGTLLGVPGQLLGMLTATKVGTNIQFSTDLTPAGASLLNISVFDGPNLVGVAAGVTNPIVALVPYGNPFFATRWQVLKDGFIRAYIHLPDRSAIQLPSPPPLQPIFGTDIIIDQCPTCATPLPEPPLKNVSAISRFDLVGTGLSSFRIIQERLGKFGQLHSAVGQAQVRGVATDLHLNNLVSGAGSPAGIEIPFTPGGSMYWRQFDAFGMMPTGAMLRASVKGAFVNGAEQILASSQITDSGFQKDIYIEFSALGAPSRRMDVLSSSLLVFSESIPGTNSLMAHVSDWPLSCGGTRESPTGPLRFFWRFWPTVNFEINNQVVAGDEIRIVAENPSQTIDHLSSFDLRASSVDSLDLVSAGTEASSPPTLQIQRFGNVVAISWSPTGPLRILQCANRVTGPFWDVPGGDASPYVTPITATNQFYRLIQH